MSLELLRAPVAPSLGSRLDIRGFEGESVLIKPNSRFMVRHHLVLKACRERGEPLPLGDGVEEDDTVDALYFLAKAAKDGTAVNVLERDDVVELTKVEVRKKQGIAALLFQRSDPEAPPPVFHHKKKKTLRPVVKETDEAETVSARLFLDLDGVDAGGTITNRTVMEEMPGLGRSYMHAVIADVLRESKYTYEDDRGEQHETYTIPTFQGAKSERIGDALKTGIISLGLK
jgi:hypothetical protein